MSRMPLGLALFLVVVVASLAPIAFAQTSPARGGPLPAGPSAAASVSAAPGSPPKRSFTDAIPCSACHTTTAWREKGASGSEANFDHGATGFPLTGQHIHAPCVACHNSARAVKRACSSCHDDFHRGRLARSCDTCHSPAGWKVTRPLELHRMTRFPLTGMHVLADCSECHQRASEHHWTEAPIDCFGCHEKEYRRPELRPVHVGDATTPPFPRDCSMCHRSMAWAPAVQANVAGTSTAALRAAPRNHDLRFPISFGLHRTATCDDCHASVAVPRAVRCIGCHVHDPARLLQQHRQPMATDGASCLSCHPGGARR
jgi:hypothetical protein